MADGQAAPTGDVDNAIWRWAENELGSGFTVGDIDSSNVGVTRGSLYYEGTADWFKSEHINPDIFNNDEALPISWKYQENIEFLSHSSWKLLSILDTKILPRCDLVLEFPCSEEGRPPLSVVLDYSNNNGADKSVKLPRTYDICAPLDVDPYTTVEGCVKLRTCSLEDVPFKVELIFTGSVVVRGHKKRKSKSKVEVRADIAAALKGVPGFKPVEGLPGQPASMVYTMAGMCTGSVAVSVKPHFNDLQTLV